MVVEPLMHRREAALRFGAAVALTPEEATTDPAGRDVLGPLGAEVVFEVAGTDGGVAVALELARPGPRVVLVGIPSDDGTSFQASTARRKGLTMLVSRRMGEVYGRTISLVAEGLVDVRSLVSAEHSLAGAPAAFTEAAARTGHKVIVRP